MIIQINKKKKNENTIANTNIDQNTNADWINSSQHQAGTRSAPNACLRPGQIQMQIQMHIQMKI